MKEPLAKKLKSDRGFGLLFKKVTGTLAEKFTIDFNNTMQNRLQKGYRVYHMCIPESVALLLYLYDSYITRI